MTAPQEFDMQASIKRLAEAQWVRRVLPDFAQSMEVPFVALRIHHHEVTPACMPHCPGWTPEPDIEKACWRIETVRLKHGDPPVVFVNGRWYLPYHTDSRRWSFETREEAELRTAEEWVHWKMEETP